MLVPNVFTIKNQTQKHTSVWRYLLSLTLRVRYRNDLLTASCILTGALHLIFNILMNQSIDSDFMSPPSICIHPVGCHIKCHPKPIILEWHRGKKKIPHSGHWPTVSVCISWVLHNFTFSDSINSSYQRWSQWKLNMILCCRGFIAWHDRENNRNTRLKVPLVCTSGAFGGISTSAVSGTLHITLTDSCAGTKKTPNPLLLMA